MARRRYSLVVEPTDKRKGWKLGYRVLPRGYTIRAMKLVRWTGTDGDLRTTKLEWADLTDAEIDAVYEGGPTHGDNWTLGERTWIELDVVSSPTEPPRCVALRAPGGISTPEQRFPIAGIVTEASAAIASADGSFMDLPQGFEYEDALFEAGRARGRKRGRTAVTAERLEEVARVAREHPRTPTAAVQHHFGYSRVYARKLIRRATQ